MINFDLNFFLSKPFSFLLKHFKNANKKMDEIDPNNNFFFLFHIIGVIFNHG
jgi:hypothetical protein